LKRPEAGADSASGTIHPDQRLVDRKPDHQGDCDPDSAAQSGETVILSPVDGQNRSDWMSQRGTHAEQVKVLLFPCPQEGAEYRRRREQAIPMGRIGEKSDIAYAMLFLVSNELSRTYRSRKCELQS
jgi:hypothetical protein